ncbi:hypothetical protein TYRP_020145 [Tyrophagus putrescentiae]|nr:hypothetical protein TYRP_020145 [Tyrophagus putrescentiae]
MNSSPSPEKRALSLLPTTSSTTADPSFYIVSPYPVTDTSSDFSTTSTPKLESHWPIFMSTRTRQVIDHSYPGT